MMNPKYKNVFMAPDEPLAVNAHTINSKLGGHGRTIAESLRLAYDADGQTIGGAVVEAGSGSGGGVLEVAYTVTVDVETSDFVITCDHTYAEIKAALDAGKRVTGELDMAGVDTYSNLIVIYDRGTIVQTIVVMYMEYDGGTCTIAALAHDSDDVIIKAGVVDMFA